MADLRGDGAPRHGLLQGVLPEVAHQATPGAFPVGQEDRGDVDGFARRIGLGGEPFLMLKFRTMRQSAEGPALTRSDDERLTPVGRFLARSRLDELPQLWHVLTGRMRLVGPRPEDPEFVELFSREYEEILSVPPGITGSTQLVHFADGIELDVDDPAGHYADEILPALA